MDISYRPYNSSEIKLLRSNKYSPWKLIENVFMMLVFTTILMITPFLLYEKFIQEVPPQIELPIVIGLEAIAVILALYFLHRLGELSHNHLIEMDVRKGEAEVIKLKTDHAVERGEYEDLGSGYYLRIDSHRTLYLEDQYYDQLQHSKKFPNTDIEIIRSRRNKQLLNIKLKGEYLKPSRKLKPFTKEQFKNGDIHEDGAILQIPIEQIQ